MQAITPPTTNLDQPRAPLEHLRCLHLSNCCKASAGVEPLISLLAAAPRLEVLSTSAGPGTCNTVAEAVAGHPCLRELSNIKIVFT